MWSKLFEIIWLFDKKPQNYSLFDKLKNAYLSAPLVGMRDIALRFGTRGGSL